MTLKLMLDSLEGVSEDMKPFYAEADGKFQLDPTKYAQSVVERETAGLRAKVDELLGEAKTAKQRAREAADQAAKEAEAKAKASGDVEALEKSWTEK